jgi:hypothetical protein
MLCVSVQRSTYFKRQSLRAWFFLVQQIFLCVLYVHLAIAPRVRVNRIYVYIFLVKVPVEVRNSNSRFRISGRDSLLCCYGLVCRQQAC